MRNTKTEKGKYLEMLITTIEEVLKKFEHFEVKHNVKIVDCNGTKRQIDVLIEAKGDPRFENFRIIIESKHWNKKVNLNTVGAFINLLESLQITRGIIVTKVGFQPGAIDKANGERSKKILLYNIKESQDSELSRWLQGKSHLLRAIPILNTERLDLKFKFNSDIDFSNETLFNASFIKFNDQLPKNFADFFFKQCVRVMEDGAKKVSNQLALNHPLDNLPESYLVTAKISFPPETLLCINNTWVEVIYISFPINYKIELNASTGVTKLSYGEFKGETKAEIISIDFPDHRYLLVRNAETGKERYFIHNDLNQLPYEIFDLNNSNKVPTLI